MFGDIEPRGDLLVSQTISEQAQHLALAGCQLFQHVFIGRNRTNISCEQLAR
jgi:hypothetical protein